MVALASTKEEVMSQLKKDIYSENDVWDFEKVGLYPDFLFLQHHPSFCCGE